MDELQLILVSPDRELCQRFEVHFKNLTHVKIANQEFELLPRYDCVVTAGNSFGLMDAGMDLAIVRFFGRHLMESIQRHILEEYLGEQPVGTSFIMETGHPNHPFVAHTPTMRVPMNIAHTDNVYKAMWAMLLAVRRHNKCSQQKIKIVACPGLGTGTGGVSYDEAALQMVLAYKHFLNPAQWINGSSAQDRQERIWYGGDWGFKHPRPGNTQADTAFKLEEPEEELMKLRDEIMKALQARFADIPQDVADSLKGIHTTMFLKRLRNAAGSVKTFGEFKEEVLITRIRSAENI